MIGPKEDDFKCRKRNDGKEGKSARIHIAYTQKFAAQDISEVENGCGNALTSIHDAYTLSATNEGKDVDAIMIKHFLNTLAEVALSIALRQVGKQ